MRARIGTALTAFAEKPRSSSTAAIGMETFIVSGRPHAAAHRLAELAREEYVRAADPALVGELEDPLCARVERPVQGVAEARHLVAGRADGRGHVARDGGGLGAGSDLCLRLFEQPRARLRRSEDHRARSQDARRDRALERAGIGGQGHPRGDVRRHHPVLRDRDQQHVEEEALVIGRLAAGEQQVEVLGEAEPAHQVAGEVAPAHLDPVGIGLADAADGGAGLADLHAARR